MKEPQGFIGAVDYIRSVIQEDGFFVLAFVVPAADGMYQFTVSHNAPPETVPSLVFNITGNLFNSLYSSSGGEPRREPK
jgi:hypothetical protein